MSHCYQRRVVFIDLDMVEEERDITREVYDYNGTEYKLVSVNQHENKLVYTFEKENEVY